MAIYHLHVKTVSRGTGSAKSKADYIAREGKYQSDQKELAYSESGHLPKWAKATPKKYWEAADTYERANGRLCVHVEFALPAELSQEQQVELAKEFCKKLAHTSHGQKLPYSMAIHKGQSNGENNPHCHLIINERINDGIERQPGDWFRRSNSKYPASGGAQKTEELRPKFWLHDTRKLWAEMANQALEKNGHKTTIDHRTLAAQGVEREPQYHLGPAAAAMERKNKAAGKPVTDRGLEYQKQLEIVELEKEISSLERQKEKDDIASGEMKSAKDDFHSRYEQWKANKVSIPVEQKERADVSTSEKEIDTPRPQVNTESSRADFNAKYERWKAEKQAKELAEKQEKQRQIDKQKQEQAKRPKSRGDFSR